ncbi:SDR family oxidoreductase [Gordonia alkaliphila]|uniref:SDR family oxidoreductase n=1 Tax=Gordonia alkaliphila TaxID=1053547 RepID=UPI001FF5839D|nr:SDR family oxidoreductase [Gordonia alkaliphila]MCK0441014.1 SDR family oxidoreductase [Gordonia alkaliphila]
MGLFQRGPARIRLDGAVVLVTGGARGIGARTACAAGDRGAHVWIGDLDPDLAERAATGAQCRRLDVTDPASWQSLVDEIVRVHGRIDVLVNNAGVVPTGSLIAQPLAEIDLTLDVNVRGVLLGMRAVLPTMIAARRGHIVNVASMAGELPLPGMVTYNASKYAALGASLAARREYEAAGIAVCAILPAAVRTELSSGADLGGTLPTVDPEQVADAILHTLRSRAAQTSVPQWVSPAWRVADLLTPEPLMRLARGVADDDQALRINANAGRRGYLDRIADQTRAHAEPGIRESGIAESDISASGIAE